MEGNYSNKDGTKKENKDVEITQEDIDRDLQWSWKEEEAFKELERTQNA